MTQPSTMLESLPAHTAVLDSIGDIAQVNAPWRQFARENGFTGYRHGIGLNYLESCTEARGPDSEGAAEVAEGLKLLLVQKLPAYRFEYPCHSPNEHRWFELWASSLGHGALVLHLNITKYRRREQEWERRITELQQALIEHQSARIPEIVSICAWCKRLRQEDGSWAPLDEYLAETARSRLSHTVCATCRVDVANAEL